MKHLILCAVLFSLNAFASEPPCRLPIENKSPITLKVFYHDSKGSFRSKTIKPGSSVNIRIKEPSVVLPQMLAINNGIEQLQIKLTTPNALRMMPVITCMQNAKTLTPEKITPYDDSSSSASTDAQ